MEAIYNYVKQLPIGTELYSPLIGECVLNKVNDFKANSPICVTSKIDGRLYYFSIYGCACIDSVKEIYSDECMLFPSKNCRDWEISVFSNHKGTRPFSLKEYEFNPEKEIKTRRGDSVRIICTNRSGLTTKPIVALVKIPNGTEVVHTYWENGVHTNGAEDDLDLFFIPKRHTGWINVFFLNNGGCDCGSAIYPNREEAAKAGNECDNYGDSVKIEWYE